MSTNKIYAGKVIAHNIWYAEDEQPIEMSHIEMMAGLAGAYTWHAKVKGVPKTVEHHGQFNKVVINGNIVSFFVARGVKRDCPKSIAQEMGPERPILKIEFGPGEVTRLLNQDRWFKTQAWFKVNVEDLQLSIF
jgi:hypothetical protein